MNEAEESISLLREIRDYLRLLAEPMLQQKEQVHRSRIVEIVGRSEKRKASVLLMKGEITRQEILKTTGLDPSDMTRLLKALAAEGLVEDEKGRPRLRLRSIDTLFEGGVG